MTTAIRPETGAKIRLRETKSGTKHADPECVKPLGPPPDAFDGSAARKLAPPGERRRSDRVAGRTTAWLSNAVGRSVTSGRTVTVEDLSMHGVGFHTEKRCHVGDRHWILVTQGAMRLSTRVRIRSVRPDGNGGWICGGEFF